MDLQENYATTYELTNPQKRIYFTEKIYPGTALYNLNNYIVMYGENDIVLLNELLNSAVLKFDAIRLRITTKNNVVMQYIQEYEFEEFETVDFTRGDVEYSFDEWIEKQTANLLFGEDKPLYKFTIFKLEENKIGFFASFHHLISDGWSYAIFFQYLIDAIKNIRQGTEMLELQNPGSYLDYIKKEKEYMISPKYERNKKFWNEKFANLPKQFLHRSSESLKGKRILHKFDSRLTNALTEYLSNQKISLNVFFLALYSIYVSKVYGIDDVILGNPIFDRADKKARATFGMTVSTMPFRTIVDHKLTVRQFMEHVQNISFNYYLNQKYPYNVLIQDLDLKGQGIDNLFSTLINVYFQNNRLVENLVDYDLNFVYNGYQAFPLEITVTGVDDSNRLWITFDYKVNDYTEEEVRHVIDSLEIMIQQIVQNHNIKISDITLLTKEQYSRTIEQLNDSNVSSITDKTIDEIFIEQADKTPENVAISMDCSDITYGQLKIESENLAYYLRTHGYKEGSTIAIYGELSIESCIMMLSIIRSGACCFPLSKELTLDEIKTIMSQIACDLLIVEDRDSMIETGSTKSITFNELVVAAGKEDCNVSRKENWVTSSSEPVVMSLSKNHQGKYTATKVNQKGLLQYVSFAKREYVLSESLCIPAYGAIDSDMNMTALVAALFTGGQVRIYQTKSISKMLELIIDEKMVNTMKVSTELLCNIGSYGKQFSFIRQWIVSGSMIPTKLATYILDLSKEESKLWYEYVPDSINFGVLIHRFDKNQKNGSYVPVGKPIDGLKVYVIDHDKNPQTVCVEGTLCITGELQLIDVVNKKEYEKISCCNPKYDFIEGYVTSDYGVFGYTQDYVTSIHKKDQKVIKNGVLIDFHEIEKEIVTIEEVNYAIVGEYMSKTGDKSLIAYMVVNQENTETVNQVKQHLSDKFPEYMVPNILVAIEQIPLTIDGRIDLLQLEELQKQYIRLPGYQTSYDWNEIALLAAISKVLENENVKVSDNFFQIGGNHQAAVKIEQILKNLGYSLDATTIMSNPKLTSLVAILHGNESFVDEEDGELRFSPYVKEFIASDLENPNYHDTSIVIKLKQEIDVSELEDVVQNLVKRHKEFFVNIEEETGNLYMNEELEVDDIMVAEYDLSDYDEDIEEQDQVLTQLERTMKRSFDLNDGFLFKACLVNLGQRGMYLYLISHKMIMDMPSWKIVVEELVQSLDEILNDKESNSIKGEKEKGFESWLKDFYSIPVEKVVNQLPKWNQRVSDEVRYEGEIEEADDWDCEVAMETVTINTDLFDAMDESSANSRRERLVHIVATLTRAIGKCFVTDHVIFEVAESLKDEVAESIKDGVKDYLDSTIGTFTIHYPMKVPVELSNLQNQIEKVKNGLEEITDHGLGYNILKFRENQIEDTRKDKIYIEDLGDLDEWNMDASIAEIESFGSKTDYDRSNGLQYLLECKWYVLHGELKCSLLYDQNRIRQEQITDLIKEMLIDYL